MGRLSSLERRYPGIPAPVLLKADLVFTGIAVNAALAEAGRDAMPHFRTVEFRGAACPIPYFLSVPDGAGGEMLVLVRPDQASPYRLDRDAAGGFMLAEDGRPVAPVRPLGKTAWFRAAEAAGQRRALAALSQHGDMLVANLAPACEYWQQPGELENYRCRFCGYGAVSERSRALGQVVGEGAIAPATLAEFRDALSRAGAETRHVYLVGGSLRDADSEGSRYLAATRAAFAGSAGRVPIGCGSQALPGQWLRRIREAGASYACFNLEIWDAALWPAICPGKAKFIGREQWLQNMLDAVEVFGRGGVLSAFVAGAELVAGFKSEARAIESALEGIAWLLARGVSPIFSPFSPALTSEYAVASRPTLDYFLKLNQEALRLRREHALPVDTRFVCARCCYAQLECDLDRLAGGFPAAAGVVSQKSVYTKTCHAERSRGISASPERVV